MQYLKFGLVFDLNFFHKLDLYQVNKTLLTLHSRCFSYSISLIYYLFQLWGNNNLVYLFKNSFGGGLVFPETWGGIELFCIPWIHQENVKSMQIINYKIIKCMSIQVTMPCSSLGNLFLKNYSRCFNPFSTDVRLMQKPGSWFFLPKCLKNTCGRVPF